MSNSTISAWINILQRRPGETATTRNYVYVVAYNETGATLLRRPVNSSSPWEVVAGK